MSQETIRPERRDDGDTPGDDAFGQVSAANQARDEEVDSVLDEIDGVLEANAEEFVKGFVQKGGE